MKINDRMIQFSIHNPRRVTVIMIIVALILGMLMVRVKVDTDPENMLSEEEAVRIFHNQVKNDFTLHDVVVLGVVNEKNPDGVFNPATLRRVHELTEFAMNLTDPDDPDRRVVTRNVIAPGTVDSIDQAGPGQIRFEWLMPSPPRTKEDALKIRDRALSNPLLKGTMVSEDGQTVAIYLPITYKDFAYHVRARLLEKIATFKGDDKFYITGLPVAEDTFGVEMFVQMAISAPVAMLMIFLLMLLFFRNLKLIIAPLIIAMLSVIYTMGLLIGTGNTVHIMSSMIPIFLMPIAVVDSIHILSEFFDRYQKVRNRRKTLEQVLKHLFKPMLYTSLTSSAGFASLALTPIPPVRVFGIFVAFGIMLAWLLTILFVPAYVMMLKEKTLANLGLVKSTAKGQGDDAFLSRQLRWLGGFSYSQAKLILILSIIALGVAGYGIAKIQINDNPVKWFQKNHDIRIADRVMNHHLSGTYEAYLVLKGAEDKLDLDGAVKEIKAGLNAAPELDNRLVIRQAVDLLDKARDASDSQAMFFETLNRFWEEKMDTAPEAEYDLWADGWDVIEQVRNRDQIFKRPDVLQYIVNLQKHLLQLNVVGKSNSVADLVKKVYQELFEADPKYFRIPDTQNAVAQSLISFQNSHKPDDLWHLVTPDYTQANIWIQLKNGDNKDMEATVKHVQAFINQNPAPVPLSHNWAGLTYLNVIWQDKMVTGMLKSFLGSFVVVFIMMAILFRSTLWGLLAMVPLTITITLIYGIIGIVGKDYDMPVAVLSSLTLGLAVDFAIHFLQRSRSSYEKTGSWKAAAAEMFEEPARAITRNVIVIAVGFTPLLLASLVPYQTVGIFLASIMAISGIGTMFILPALLTVFVKWMFKEQPV